MAILPHVALSGLCTQQCAVEAGCVTVCGAFSDISGGVQPYTFSLTAGSIPPGMTLNGLALAGTFPAQPGNFVAAPPPFTFAFTVGVTDALGATASVNAGFNIFHHIAMQGGTIPSSPNTGCFAGGAGPNNPGCTAMFPYSGGTPGGTPTYAERWLAPAPQVCPPPSPGAPPPPCQPVPLPTITVSGGTVTVAVQGGNGFTATLEVVLTDQSPCGPGPVMCSSAPALITVNESGP